MVCWHRAFCSLSASQVMSFSTDGHATVYDVVIEGVTSRGRLIREHTEIVTL